MYKIDKRCNTCKWYGEKGVRKILTIAGRCRKRAPTIEGFPIVVGADIACGDWKEDYLKEEEK